MIRFIMVGGFLGAGKTTTIARLAAEYRRQGLNVAIVTNDQGTDLVDTQRLRALGLHVGEISGGCFCGDVEGLLETVEQLGIAARPQAVFVEPIGSCIDLAATVIRPLVRRCGDEASVAPYVVVVKPRHGLRVLEEGERVGVSPTAAYLFQKQLEEADVLAVNRVDELSASELARLTSQLSERYPGRPILPVSAKTGAGFTELGESLARQGDFGRRVLEVDSRAYAAAEATLSWLNASLLVTASEDCSLDSLVLDVVRRIQTRLVAAAATIAHVEVLGSFGGSAAAANAVGNDAAAELSIESRRFVSQAEVTINARVGCEPAVLRGCVQAALDEACAAHRLEFRVVQMQSFRPGAPTPGYRVV